jgi:hypothetical protein
MVGNLIEKIDDTANSTSIDDIASRIVLEKGERRT